MKGNKWSEREDSNLRPPRPERGALPGCATLRLYFRFFCQGREGSAGTAVFPAGGRSFSKALNAPQGLCPGVPVFFTSSETDEQGQSFGPASARVLHVLSWQGKFAQALFSKVGNGERRGAVFGSVTGGPEQVAGTGGWARKRPARRCGQSEGGEMIF